ncbi:hypothetical protein ACYEXS_26890 [Paenibacillus sp. MAH-36]|uniref:Uncharacterized protein n=1 Tax=Paenibacillus violae TaxID=3077234 RepID=A0ABU3RCY0_9BACL|nr:hypothetical protein [Paenibacillus sp. PFR10]MDU0202118.1 hypothetical protein [Paenibacillus sp. PFR10]
MATNGHRRGVAMELRYGCTPQVVTNIVFQGVSLSPIRICNSVPSSAIIIP